MNMFLITIHKIRFFFVIPILIHFQMFLVNPLVLNQLEWLHNYYFANIMT